MGSNNILWMYELAVGRDDPDFVVIDADTHRMMRSRVDKVDPYPLLTRLGLHDL